MVPFNHFKNLLHLLSGSERPRMEKNLRGSWKEPIRSRASNWSIVFYSQIANMWRTMLPLGTRTVSRANYGL